jgi:hypothetical protein
VPDGSEADDLMARPFLTTLAIFVIAEGEDGVEDLLHVDGQLVTQWRVRASYIRLDGVFYPWQNVAVNMMGECTAKDMAGNEHKIAHYVRDGKTQGLRALRRSDIKAR